MSNYKITPNINKNKSTEYYEDLKYRNKENDEKLKKKVRNICFGFIITVIILVAIFA